MLSESVYARTLSQHYDYPEYDIVSAFIDPLTTRRPHYHIWRAAWQVGYEAGLPFDHLKTREELMAWLQGGSSSAATSNQGNQLASAVTAQADDNGHVAGQEEAP